jgi:hypothetical protein
MGECNATIAAETRAESARNEWSEQVERRVAEITAKFRQEPTTPAAANEFEKELKKALDAAGRDILQEELNRLQSDDRQEMPGRIRYHKETYRINKKTKADIATSFGTIRVWSFYYLCEEPGEPGIHPLHLQLGLLAGSATSVLAERVAGWAVDHSQRETRALLEREHGLRWSNDRLRNVLREFRRCVASFRQETQAERLLGWLEQAERSRGRHRPVLAAGRDGIMVPMRGRGYQEASTGTVSVYDRRKRRLGTVYLGQMPEAHQVTLTRDLTELLKTVLQDWTGSPPRLLYLTDKGHASEEYYRKTLLRMKDPRHPGRLLKWEWVLDFFHACGYVSKLRAALFGDKGFAWFRKMRHWLKHREQGVANILRSATQHYHQGKLSKAAEEEFWKAYRYLRRNQRWMDYPQYQRQGMPIGSGVTEAACKTVFTQRFKRSGMSWQSEMGQTILDLRVLRLSGVWDEVVRKDLRSRQLPQPASTRPQLTKNPRKAA